MHKKQQRDREEIEKYLQTKGLVSIDHLFEILQDPSGRMPSYQTTKVKLILEKQDKGAYCKQK